MAFMSATLDTDAIDAQATRLANLALDGFEETLTVLWELAILVDQSGVVARATKSRLSAATPLDKLNEVTETNARLVMSKITEQVGAPSNLDLQLIADGASICGWASKLAAAATLSSLRTYEREHREVLIVDDAARPDEHDQWRGDGSPVRGVPLPHSASAEDDLFADADAAEDILDEFVARTYKARTEARTHEGARAAAQLLGVPAPTRMDRARDRARVARLLDRQPLIAHSAVSRLAAGALDDVDPALAKMWEGYTPDELATVAEANPLLASILAASAVTPMPPVGERRLAEMRDRLANIGDGPRWGGVLRKTLRAFADVYADGVADFATGGTLRAKTRAENSAARTRWIAAAAAAARFPGAPLGTTVDDIYSTLADCLDAVSSDLAFERSTV